MRLGHVFRVIHLLLSTVILASLLSAASRLSNAQQNAVDLEGKQVDPVRAASGKVVVLVFLRSDCPISNRYAPTIQQISARYSGQAAFWLVYPDKKASAASIRKYLQDYGYK